MISELHDTNSIRKKLSKEVSAPILPNNSSKRSSIKDSTRKPTSLSSVPGKNTQKETTKHEFVIPELPEGRLLEMKIYSNWGDKYLVGMNGIELFDSNGNEVRIEKVNK